MTKIKSEYICQSCGYESSGWLGKCPNCGSWGSLVEQLTQKTNKTNRALSAEKPQKLNQISSVKHLRLVTQSSEINRVLGGGLVPGSVVLLAGEPGVGKSTLLLQLAQNLADKNLVLYVSGEESAQQLKLRAERLQVSSSAILILNQTDVDLICQEIKNLKPRLTIIDSIQTLTTNDLTGSAGSVGQVRECAARLQQLAKNLNLSLILVGHVTKEGVVAGPKVLEHLVDVVLYLEGERYQQLRILRGIKNRFGPTDEVGLLTMEEKGLLDVVDPSCLFLEAGSQPKAGSVITVTLEGTRPLLIEIQALVVASKTPIPRRVVSGFDFNRLQMLLAILIKHLKLPLFAFDVYVNVASGFKISEPAADLAVCLAIISSFKNKPLLPQTAVLGEVGLLGEIRPVSQASKRIKEAQKLGFTKVITNKEGDLISLTPKLF